MYSLHTHVQGNTHSGVDSLTLGYLREVEFPGIKSVSVQGIP